MTGNIIIKPSVQKQFDSFMAHGRVLFFSAPCGFGKTVLADALLRGQKVLRLSAGAPDCAIPSPAQDSIKSGKTFRVALTRRCAQLHDGVSVYGLNDGADRG